MNARSLSVIALLGGVGGGINAALCYFKWPVPIMTTSFPSGGASPMEFHWSIILGGLGHGAVLAIVPVLLIGRAAKAQVWLRCAAVPVIGWLSGWWSWSAMNASFGIADSGMLAFVSSRFWKNIAWPFEGSMSSAVPFQYFGVVGACLAALLLIAGASRLAQRGTAIAIGMASGILGSLWWWIGWKPWWFSLLHGVVWGALVGYGLWRAAASEQRNPASS